MSDDKLLDDVDFFQSFHIDPVSICRALEDCGTDILNFSDDFTILSPVLSQRSGKISTPTMFKKPAAFHTPHRIFQSQKCDSQKYINFSFNQPSTPKTPAFACHLATPLMSSFDVTMLTTPMLMKTLDDIQQEARNKDKSAPYPDILQLINDDSSCTGVKLDHHLEQCSESNVTNNNQLVDHSQERKHHVSPDSRTVIEKKNDKTEVYKSPPRIFHRARRRTKLMTEEERISIQRQQREKQKQKRKDRFTNVPRTGTRKSHRVRRQVVKYGR